MKFDGEHLLPGQFGHFFVILAFITALISTVGFFLASKKKDPFERAQWLKFSRYSFAIHTASVFIIFSVIIYICFHHYYEYMYAYKHASRELEYKYLLACIWEGQEGSFLLWAIWHSVLAWIIIYKGKEWEPSVMSVISLAQFFLMMMILGIYLFQVKIGNSPFTLTRNEINAPIFSQPNYLNFIKDGMGLNILLRNYWMVIHPPVLFLGFATTLIPFAFAYAGLTQKKYGDWIQPALPWALFSTCVLGVGIMMGGKWAYESLSFGGYWAWDPVENASLVPWLLLVAGLHTMLIYKATGHSLRAGYLFIILAFSFVLYSTFLTRTGILGDTSVHSFTEAGKAINIMIGSFVAVFSLPMLFLFLKHFKNIPTNHKEEHSSSREFWMFIGSLILFLSALFIIAKTSVPVYNKIFGTRIAAPEEVEFSYNKVMVLVAFMLGMLTAITQYLKYKQTPGKIILQKISLPTIISAIITTLVVLFNPITFYKHGPGFLGAIYIALFAGIYAAISNAMYIWSGLKGNLSKAGSAITHTGFAIMLVGMLISSSNKEVISSSMVNGINLPMGKDPMNKKADDPRENLTLLREVPASMGSYEVTYLRDSAGHEKGRKFYSLQFNRKDSSTKQLKESFILKPDVYLMKDNNMSSNPDIKSFTTKDIFTYVSYVLGKQNTEDTSSFVIKEMQEGDTAYYGNGYMILNKVEKNPVNDKFQFKGNELALMASVTIVSKENKTYHVRPLLQVDPYGIIHRDDTCFAQNLFLRFQGVSDNHRIKLGIKETDQLIDFVTVKAYVFPMIKFVWLGLIIMAAGLLLSMVNRAGMGKLLSSIILIAGILGVFYMFLIANN